MRGYSLTELMVVMSIIGILAMMQFYGMRLADDMEKLKAEQKQLLSHLRSLQNKAVNGETSPLGGSSHVLFLASDRYVVNNITERLPDGMTITTNGTYGINTGIFFHHPLLSSFTTTCRSASDGRYLCQCTGPALMSCTLTSSDATSPFNIRLTYNGNSKTVRLEGGGSRINRMYLVD